MSTCDICKDAPAEIDGRCPPCRVINKLLGATTRVPPQLKGWLVDQVRIFTAVVEEETAKAEVQAEQFRKAAEAATPKASASKGVGSAPRPGSLEETKEEQGGAEEDKTEVEETKKPSEESQRKEVSPRRGEKLRDKKSRSKKREKKHRKEHKERGERKEKKQKFEKVKIEETSSEEKEETPKRGVAEQEAARGSKEGKRKKSEEKEELKEERSRSRREKRRSRSIVRRIPREPAGPPPGWNNQHRRYEPSRAIGSAEYRPLKWTNKGKTKVEKQRAFRDYYYGR